MKLLLKLAGGMAPAQGGPDLLNDFLVALSAVSRTSEILFLPLNHLDV